MENSEKLLEVRELNNNEATRTEQKYHESSDLTKKAAFIQIFIAMMANLTVLAPGMGMAFPSVTSEILLRDKAINFTANQVSWFAAITPLHCPYGGPLSSYLVLKIGRKGTLLFINFLSIIYWTITGFSTRSDSDTLFVQLLFARLITGFTIGEL